jgi:phosphatidylglycerol---prolipoprotein diacylglyceryl transferase
MKPLLFHIGPVPVYSFGAMIALGVLVSLYLMSRRTRLGGFPDQDRAVDMVFVTVISGFLGARLYYILQNLSVYLQNPLAIFAFWEGGLVFYGGVIGALCGIFIFSKIKKQSALQSLDFLLPYVALTHAAGRVGCFLNGCCYGKTCDLPWAVKFEETASAVHPVQLYEAAFNVLLFLFLNRKYGRKRFDGQITALYFVGYAIGRFVMEFFRGDNPLILSLTHNQWFSLLLFLFAAGFYGFLSKTSPKAPS